MKIFRLMLFLLAASLSGWMVALAQEGKSTPALLDMSLEELMNVEVETVYAASRHQQKVTEAPAAITVITADDIQRYGYRTLVEVLRSVRGFFLTYDRQYNYLGVAGFSRPGDYGTRVLMLIDGHRVNDNIYDASMLGTECPLDIDLIDRIEVIRGPNSSLYVASAFLGVINIVTKRGRMVGSPELSTETGSFGTYKGRASYGESFKNGLEMLLSGSYYSSQGPRRLYFPEFHNPSTNNGVAVNADDDQYQQLFGSWLYRDLRVEALYASREKGIPTASYGTAFNDSRTRSTDIRGYLDLQYDKKLSANTDFMGRAYYDLYEYHGVNAYYDPASASLYLNEDLTRGKWAGTELSVSTRVRSRHRFSAGAEFRRNLLQEEENYDLSPFVRYGWIRNTSSVLALYSQGEITLTEKLLLNLGLHYDHYSSFGGTLNPRAALIYKRFHNTTLKFLYAQTFRPPTEFELSYSSATSRSNPNLQPERAKTTSVVLEQYIGRGTRLTVSGFYYPLRQLITEETDPENARVFYANSGSVDMRGLEFEVTKKWQGGLEAGVDYSLQDLENQASAQPLSNVPKHLGGLKVSIPFLGKALFASADVRYVSRRRTLLGNSVPPYVLPNFTLFSQRLKQHFRISASLYNAFNSRYGDPGAQEHLQDVIWQDGRTFRLKVTYSF